MNFRLESVRVQVVLGIAIAESLAEKVFWRLNPLVLTDCVRLAPMKIVLLVVLVLVLEEKPEYDDENEDEESFSQVMAPLSALVST